VTNSTSAARHRLARLALTAILLGSAREVYADDAATPSLTSKRPLDAEDLREKREGFYPTVIPLAGYSPDEGLGLGARAYGYWDGDRSDPLFGYTPYRHRLYVQGYATTGGVQAHGIDWDAPYVAGSEYRMRATFEYQRWNTLRYYGRGEASLDDRAIPGLGSFQTDSAYDAAAAARLPDGSTYARYDEYGLTLPELNATVERDLAGGTVRAQLGVGVSYGMARESTGQLLDVSTSDGGSTRATENPTAVHTDCLAGRVRGCGDGWNNAIKIGLVYDTRDYEPDPSSGLFADVTAEIASPLVGSGWTYARGTLAARGFVSLLPGLTRLVLAARGLVAISSGGVPYWDMPTIALTEGDIRGLGGLRTLRGYRQDRYVGNVMADVNVELRWTVGRFAIGAERFHVMMAPFADAGRVFDAVPRITWRRWKPDAGVALRVGWNLATIVSADYAVSPEGSALYVDFGHQF
jgi:outer membrane protein assembly factor BamA